MVCWGARRGRSAADGTCSAVVALVGAPGAQPGLAWLNTKYEENLSEQEPGHDRACQNELGSLERRCYKCQQGGQAEGEEADQLGSCYNPQGAAMTLWD